MSNRAVFDCVIFLQAAISEASPAFACFRLVEEGRVVLCLSPDFLTEVREVLARPRLRAKFRRLTLERIDAFLANIQAKAVMADEVPRVISHPRDPDDEPYLNLALPASASFLVSRDNDLLDLGKDADFARDHPGITILDPVSFLQRMASPPS